MRKTVQWAPCAHHKRPTVNLLIASAISPSTKPAEEPVSGYNHTSAIQSGIPLQLPDHWKYPEGVREISNSALRFYYRQKAETTQHRFTKGERVAKAQPQF